MTTIDGAGGPGGIGGPGRPDDPSEIDALADDEAVGATGSGAPAPAIDALAADIAAGRLTRSEAIDRLVEATAGPGLDAAQRAELRELLNDLVANDPHLRDVIGRI